MAGVQWASAERARSPEAKRAREDAILATENGVREVTVTAVTDAAGHTATSGASGPRGAR
ncbi:hypothetical protein [Streptomyces gardneri]|uniref:hypothetical protein n=1 Tax=Streptomyces gardneri TaxID=66892 RepID=UPI0035E1AE25